MLPPVITKLKSYLNWNTFLKVEPWLFYTLVIIGLFPVLIPKYFFNLDGATHLYNAGLIKELLWGSNETVRDFFVLNNMPVPNWMGHLIMAVSLLFVPDYLALKIFVLIYLFFTPIFFRSFILSVSPENKVFSVFMIIMAHNGLFYLGSYNMSIALTFSFAALAFFNRHANTFKVWNTALLFIILLAVYFSHLLIFMITIFLLCLLVVSEVSIERNDGSIRIEGWKLAIRKLLMIVVAGFPGLWLTANYILKVDSLEAGAVYIPFAELVFWLWSMRALGAPAHLMDINCANILVVLFASILAINLIFSLKDWRSRAGNKKSLSISAPQLWFLLIIGVLYLYFTLPNANVVTERLGLLFFILLITALAMLKYPKWVHILSFLILIVVQLQYVDLNTKDMLHLTKTAKKIKEEAGDKIEDGSIVVAFDYNNYWLYVHANNYLAGGRPIVILDNYEAHLEWFPINWADTKYNLEYLTGLVPDNSWAACKFYRNPEYPEAFSVKAKDGSSTVIKYVYMQGSDYNLEDPCHVEIQEIVTNGYEKIVENDFCRLYRLKEN